MDKVLRLLLVLAAVALAVWIGMRVNARQERRDELAAILREGKRLEAGGEAARAALVYAQGADLELEPKDRATLRMFEARARIDSGDLGTALGILGELTAEPEGSASLDVGPLYKALGNKALERGDRDLARIAFQTGRAVAPERTVEFNKEMEKLLPNAETAPGKSP